MMPLRVAKPTKVRSKGTRKSSSKLLASDDVTLSAQINRSLASIKAELAKSRRDLLTPITRLHRTLRGLNTVRIDHFARQQGGVAVLLDVIHACGTDETVAVAAVQALSMTTGSCPKLAARLAKRTTGAALLRAFSEYKGTRNDVLMAGLLASIADIAAHDVSLGVAFASRGWATILVDFVRKHLRSVPLVLPAVRAMTYMINPATAVAFCGAGGVALAMTLVQSYSAHIKYHEILKHSLKLLAACVQRDTYATARGQRSSVRKMLTLLVEWIHLDVRHKHDDVRKEIVLVLTRMVGSQEGGGGSQAFRDVGGIGIVLDIIEQCKASHHDTNARFVSSCYALLRSARPRMALPPVPSALVFVLPHDLQMFNNDGSVCGADEDNDVPESDEDEAVPRGDGDGAGSAERVDVDDNSEDDDDDEGDDDDDDDDIEMNVATRCQLGGNYHYHALGDAAGTLDTRREMGAGVVPEGVAVVDLTRLMTTSSIQRPSGDHSFTYPFTHKQRLTPTSSLSGLDTPSSVTDVESATDEPLEAVDAVYTKYAYSETTDLVGRTGGAVAPHSCTGRFHVVSEKRSFSTSITTTDCATATYTASSTVVLPPLIASRGCPVPRSGRQGAGARRQSPTATPPRTPLHASAAFIMDSGCFRVEGSARALTGDPVANTDPPVLVPTSQQVGVSVPLGCDYGNATDQPLDPPQERYPSDFDVAVEMAQCFPELQASGVRCHGDGRDGTDQHLDSVEEACASTVVQTVREDIVLDPPTPFSEAGALGAVTSPACAAPRQTSAAGPASGEPLLRIRARKALQRRLLHDEMVVLRSATHVRDHVVYDVDDVSVADSVGDDALTFESRFESGNLRRAFQVHADMYDLVLAPDINSTGHTQWFFFSVSGMKVDTTYRFNIVNLEKSNSQYNFGMQPVVFSELAAQTEGKGWHRCGTKICYFKNSYRRDHPRSKALYTATFSLSFAHAMDTCYIAYHFPFTYSDCDAHVTQLTRAHPAALRRHLLCHTLGGNKCDVLTITSFERNDALLAPMHQRDYIVLSARVHPGESNSSWVMKGALDFLVSDNPTACQLRRRFVFKVIPMLNPDGVANGNHRCSLAGCDLNRKWRTPHPDLHPTVFRTKMLFEYLKHQGITPALYCDFHGHSRKKMIFMYGCTNDKSVHEYPKHLAAVAPQFSWRNSQFGVSSDKEGSARVVVWRQYGVERSYTMESTFCGFDRGVLRGNHIDTSHLETMGRIFVAELQTLPRPHHAPSAVTPVTAPLLVRGNSWA